MPESNQMKMQTEIYFLIKKKVLDEEIQDFELEIKFIGFQYLLNMFLIELELPVVTSQLK